MELKIINQTRGRKDKQDESSIICNYSDRVIDLKTIIINSLNLTISASRIGLFFEDLSQKDSKVFLARNDKPLRDYGLHQGMTIVVKDLGPQIGWRTTYIIEYLGPFLMIFYYFFFHLGAKNSNNTQKLGFIMSTFHYGKRILESIFVHEFSNSTMPLKNLFINCAHYWVIYGLICGYSLFNSNYKEPGYNVFMMVILTFLFFSAEIKNLKCHLILKDLKNKNKGEKGIPSGEGFEFVSCANYFWEFLSWVFFSVLVNSIPFYLFTFFGFYIMRIWAIKKHKNYLATFGERYPKERKAFSPFLI